MTSCLAALPPPPDLLRSFGQWIASLEWTPIVIVGLCGNLAFSIRFLIQWSASEKRKEPVIPVAFWYWSIAGTALMVVYFCVRRDPVGILAYLPNTAVYLRNLVLMRRKAAAV